MAEAGGVVAVAKASEHKGKRLRVAMIRCGGISEMHLRVMQKFSDVEIVEGVDIEHNRLTARVGTIVI